MTAEGETPTPVVEESNDPAPNAILVEEPVKESVDTTETFVGKVQEPSIGQTGSASVEAPVVVKEVPRAAPLVSDMKHATMLDPAALQVAQEESVRTFTQRRPPACEAVLRPEHHQELPELVDDYESTSLNFITEQMTKTYIEGPELIQHARDSHMDVDILQRQQSGLVTTRPTMMRTIDWESITLL